jgi:hypothetical protein
VNVSIVPPLSAAPDPASCTATSTNDVPATTDVFAVLLASLAPSTAVPTCVSSATADDAATAGTGEDVSTGSTSATGPGSVMSSCAFGAPGTIPTTTASGAISTTVGSIAPPPQGAFDGPGLVACPADAFEPSDSFDVRTGAAGPKVAGPAGSPEVFGAPAGGIVTPPIAQTPTGPIASSHVTPSDSDAAADVAVPLVAPPAVDVRAPIDVDAPARTEAPVADVSAPTTTPPSVVATDVIAPETAVIVDDASTAPMPDPALDTSTIATATSAPRNVSTTADVAPTSLGRLVAATVPQLRGTTDEVRMSVRLDPPSLGHVTVDISSRDGAVHVVVRPTEATTTDLLAAQRSAVSAALTDAGFQLGGFDVRSNDRRDAPKARPATLLGLDEVIEPDSPTLDDGALRL